MFEILIIIGWIIAIGCLLFLGVESIRHRRSASRQERELKKSGPLDGTGDGRTQNNIAIAPAHRPVSINFYRGLWLLGFVLFILWETFWISEISDYFSEATDPLQLPYFFLIVVMVGIPLGAYLLMRRQLRRTVVRA